MDFSSMFSIHLWTCVSFNHLKHPTAQRSTAQPHLLCQLNQLPTGFICPTFLLEKTVRCQSTLLSPWKGPLSWLFSLWAEKCKTTQWSFILKPYHTSDHPSPALLHYMTILLMKVFCVNKDWCKLKKLRWNVEKSTMDWIKCLKDFMIKIFSLVQ